MSLLTVAQGIRTVIGKATNYSVEGPTRNVTIGDYKVLDRGVVSAAIILYSPSKAGRTATPLSRHGGYYSMLHAFTIQVMRRYTYDETTYENILSDAWEIMTILDQYPKLGGVSTVIQSEVIAVSDPTWLGLETGDSPLFGLIELTLSVTEETPITFAE